MNFGTVNLLSNSIHTTLHSRRSRRTPDMRHFAPSAPMRLDELRSPTPQAELACNDKRDSKAA